MLTAWALYLGCAPVVVALLGALPSLAQVIQIPSAWLSSSLGCRRVAIIASTASRLVLLPLVALPFLEVTWSQKRELLLLIAGAHIVLGVMGSNAWTTWMGALVPERIRGRYFGKRLALTSLSSAVVGLAVGLTLERTAWLGKQSYALAGFALLAALAGLLTRPLMARQHEPGSARPARGGLDRGAIRQAFRDPMARRLITYQAAWNAAIGVSASFFAVHLLVNLRMSFSLLAAHAAGAALVRMLVNAAWGKTIDRIGAKPVLVICSFGLFLVPLLWLAPPPSALRWVIAFDALFAGTLWAGHGQATFQLPLAIAPDEQRPYYLAIFAAAGGVAFALAAAAGGLMAHLLPTKLIMMGKPILTVQLLFVLSAAGRLLSSPLAIRLQEPARVRA